MIVLKDIVQEYQNPLSGVTERIVDNISIAYDKPGIYMLLGPSGCGKSTVLRMMGGVRPFGTKTPTSGEVTIDDKPCTAEHPDVVTVFQQYANFPHLTVRENVAFPFRLALWRSLAAKEREERIDAILESVGLKERANNRPSQLSGGQNQRLALATALVLRPRILLMDEPFGALDAQTRAEMQALLVKLWTENPGTAIVFVTHDITEAQVIGDRITVLSTRPAKIAADIIINQPRPPSGIRPDEWLRSREAIDMEERIINVLRAQEGRNPGTMRVTV